MSTDSPEKRILTRLFLAQRRLRFVRGVAQGLRWFAAGALAAALGLIFLWNWDRLPGPWQWAASAGRPAELLWLPFLLGLGGFARQWLTTPSARETAHRVDRIRDGRDRLLTAIDWILSEKPRTLVSERLLSAAAAELDDEGRLRRDLRRIEPVSLRQFALLLTLALPIFLLLNLPAHVGLPDTAAVWMGPKQVDRLTEQLARELQESRKLDNPEAKLKELLRKLEQERHESKEKTVESVERELTQLSDTLKEMAKGQDSARELLETLAERARQGLELSSEDRLALEQLKKLLQPDSQSALEKAESAWSKGDAGEAAESLEELQRETGQTARELQEMASQGEQGAQQQQESAQGEGGAPQDGMEFDAARGDQHPGGPADAPGQMGEATGQGDFGRGTTEQEKAGDQARGLRSRREAERTSDRVEEFRNLHEPLRTEEDSSQTRVQGQLDPDGPRQRTSRQGRGIATEPAELQSSDSLLRYREQAENAILREEIPAEHRDEVRQYFEGLDR